MSADNCSTDKPLTTLDPVAILAKFGKWPVLPGENLQAYEALRDAAIVQFPPRDLFDFWDLRRAIDLIWEAMRYQRCTNSLIAISLKEALGRVVDALAPLNAMNREALVEGWFRDTAKRIEVVKLLQPYGFDEDTPMAMAMAMRSGELGRFTEIRRRDEIQAAAHLREIARRREAATPVLENSADESKTDRAEVTATV